MPYFPTSYTPDKYFPSAYFPLSSSAGGSTEGNYFPAGYFLSAYFPAQYFPLATSSETTSGHYFPVGYFTTAYYPTGYFPETSVGPVVPDIESGITYLWQYVYEGTTKQFLNGFPFSVAYQVSDFFGNACPALEEGSTIALYDTNGTKILPIAILASTNPPDGSQVIMATFPPQVVGSYLVAPEIVIGGQSWASVPDRIAIL